MTPADLGTPALLLDWSRFERNIARMDDRMAAQGVALRPHVKTVKSAAAGRAMTARWSGAITVSTLKEAEEFLAAGFDDILYAVGIAPSKLSHAQRIARAGARLLLILDSVAAAHAVAAHGRAGGTRFPVLIEIDSDGHRAGVRPDDGDTLVAIGRALADGAELHGVITHGGGSYDAASPAELPRHAALERQGVTRAAAILHAAGFPCPVVSVGSTPTALFGTGFDGVTEVRAGVYATMDLVMAGLGVCAIDDIALSVLTSVIGHQPERGWLIIDAGWMALSRDRGTARQSIDQGYGLVCDEKGAPIGDLIVVQANQEQGIVAQRDGGALDVRRFPIGTLLRVLPNHACATAAQHGCFHVLSGDAVTENWPRFSGW